MKIKFDSQKAKDPVREKGVQVPYAPARRKVSQWRWYLILLLVSSPLIYLLARLVLSMVIVSAPGYLSLERVAVNSTAAGIVDTIPVRIGEQVHPGQLLATLYNPSLNERRHVLLSRIEALEAGVQGPALKTRLLLTDRIRLAQKEVAYQHAQLNRVRFVYGQGAATVAELNLAEAHYRQAQLALNRARTALAEYHEHLQQVDQNRQTTVQAQRQVVLAELQAVTEQQDRLAQRAGVGGKILDILVEEGDSAGPGTPLLVMGRAAKPVAIIYLDPKYARYALKGRLATVTLPGNKKVRARVVEDATLTRRLPAAISSPIGSRDQMILVTLEFLQPLPLADSIDGLPVTARFDSLVMNWSTGH